MNVCVIGAGTIGTDHAKSWHAQEGSRVVAVVDPAAERARELAAEVGGAAVYTHYRDALDNEKPDVVSVCTPANFHADMTIDAASRGIHVLVEKAVALHLEDVDRMIAARDEHGVKVCVAMQRRYAPATDLIRDYLKTGALGRPLFAREIRGGGVRPKPAMHDALGNGGAVIDVGVHSFDFWRVIFRAEPARVAAAGLTLAADAPELKAVSQKAVDTACVTVEYSSGDIGVFMPCWGTPRGAQSARAAEVLGPAGVVTYDQQGFTHGGSGGEIVFEERREGVMRHGLTQHVIACIREDRDPVPSLEDGRAALRVALAALESIRTGQTISL